MANFPYFCENKLMIMKKLIFYSLFSIGCVIAIILIFNPQKATGSLNGNIAAPGTELPDSVMKFVQTACMDCHSDDGSGMARGKVNFSKWAGYDAEKQLKKANAICKELTQNDMPPKKWRANNPDNVPTQAQIDMMCRWAKSLQK
jgi:hypothetical protein